MKTDLNEQQRRAIDAERLQYESIKTAITRARKLLDRTEQWADNWHADESGDAPFDLAGRFYATDLLDVALTGQAYRAAAEQKALLS